MVLPGLITSALGLLLLLPPVRALLRPIVIARATRRAERGRARFAAYAGSATFGAPSFRTPTDPGARSPFGGPVYDAEAHLTRPPTSPSGPGGPPELGS
jgi:UPF0716 protein FxsA